MGANIPTPEVDSVTVSAEVLSSSEVIQMDAREKARVIFESNPDKKLPALADIFNDQESDPTARNYALAEFITLNRTRTDDFLAATEFDSFDAIKRVNDYYDERDSDVGLIEGIEKELLLETEEVA